MYPILIKIGPFAIYTYGFFVAMGFLAGILLGKYEAGNLGQDPEKISDLCFYILISAIAGARLFYILTTPETFLNNPLEIFKIWNGGLVFYGGFIGALTAAFIYLNYHKMPLWQTIDILTPSLALGHFLGRLGCFFAGCCYGKSCDLPWAVTFTHPESLALKNIPLHPTQLYSSFANLIIFCFLWYFRKYKRFEGQLFWVYVLIYAVVRSIIEIFRGDFRGSFFMETMSTSQVIAGILCIIAVFMLFILGKQAQTKPETLSKTK
ncbi:Phosphatidylglycerol--prolipoprotein diacylglyceryl transferase [Desulfonema limicola]|uniref:Phosphatidylglycerol--prolipoprotein diacylglyceryl transferase n=1 Tax=Desulfonema limicola TaxID=45656 RepID=A0A975B7N3_9BACT|nr:prolipoprotein diacylglyceryl transferase [Desulfonema limicola]QTA80371.1 Phosphatidylglycerol--prolipoprotein diacylglyceryl transferase [Desulfonema limicola]